MPKLIVYQTPKTPEEIEDIRRKRVLQMTPSERMELLFNLMSLASIFKKGPIKKPQHKGILLVRSIK